MIRNFIYLDIEKLNSLSSQIFEGVTEYVLNESTTDSENTESQKGPIGSGRILGDILRQTDKKSEKKFLNDYSYSLFEKKLIDDKRVGIIESKDQSKNVLELLNGKPFVKVRSKLIFNDINSILHTLQNFNKVGKAIAYVSNFKEIETIREKIEELKKTTKDKNQLNALETQYKTMTNADSLAQKSGLRQNQNFLDDLSLLLSYGFQDQLEVQMKLADSIFSANLKRENLREKENLVIRKYSRKTEIEFILMGIVTQSQGIKEDDPEEELDNIKRALMNMISHLTNLESTFTGRLDNEIIVDPIAIYTEL